MKPLIFTLSLLFAITLVNAQHYQPEPGFRSFSINTNHSYNKYKPFGAAGFTPQTNTFQDQKSLTIIDMGTAANAYSYGHSGGQRSFLCYNHDIQTITHIHRMGGILNPQGYSGDLGYDYSLDGGISFSVMNECYVAPDPTGWSPQSARHPNHGIFNPSENTNPQNAYIAFFAPVLFYSNDPFAWGDYCYGVCKLNAPQDATRHVEESCSGVINKKMIIQ